jgi:hypothetical protein
MGQVSCLSQEAPKTAKGNMHYKNGRPAKPGDKVIDLPTGLSGILHSTQANSTTCNGRLAQINQNDAYVTISECLHLDDIAAASVPDSSKPGN